MDFAFSEEQEMLRRAARATLALTEPAGRWDATGITLEAKPVGGGWQLDGVKLFVPDAEHADYIVVAARTRGEGDDGISLFLVKGRPKGMTVNPLKTLDMTRRWSEVRSDGVELEAHALMGAPHTAWPRLKRAVHGGIGFTWEHDMHLYFKRAKASEVTLGDATYHRELVAQALDL